MFICYCLPVNNDSGITKTCPIKGLFTTCTQNAEEVETEIYEEIKNLFGHYDKENFLSNLV